MGISFARSGKIEPRYAGLAIATQEAAPARHPMGGLRRMPGSSYRMQNRGSVKARFVLVLPTLD